MNERIINPDGQEEDALFDVNLRPSRLKDYLGQTKVKEKVGIFIQAAKKRKEALDHVLLYGPPGNGKTTVAEKVGYSSPYALSTAFKRVRGVSPQEHRTQVLASR